MRGDVIDGKVSTGLFDKNGREICEGHLMHLDHLHTTRTVVWHEDGYFLLDANGAPLIDSSRLGGWAAHAAIVDS